MSTERRITTNEKPSAGTFPMTPAQHRQWAQNMRREKSNVFLIERNGFFSYARQIRKLLRENDVAILHAHFIHYKEKLAALFAAKTCGHRVDTVLHLHNHLAIPKSPLRALPQRFYLSFVSRFVCCSRSVAQRLIADGIAPSRVAIAGINVCRVRFFGSRPPIWASSPWV